MLKHIPTVQPSSTGSRNHHLTDYTPQTISGALHQHFASNSTTLRSPRHCNDLLIYDSLVHPVPKVIKQQTPLSVHRLPFNHSQLSVNISSRPINNSNALNLSTLSTSKHSIDSASPGNDLTHPANHHQHSHYGHHYPGNALVSDDRSQIQTNGGLDLSKVSRLPNPTTTTPSPVNPAISQIATISTSPVNQPGSPQDPSWTGFCLKRTANTNPEARVKEMLSFLGLLCLVSLLLAILSHIFLLKLSPVSVMPSSSISPEEYTIVYEVTLALCALALSLNLCCLLVCALQFLFALKLVKSSFNQSRTNMYLQKSSASRMCAVGGFFVSIPVFLTGMILYTFIQFHLTPAIIMSVLIGMGILFCGCAMVHNVFVWQREKTIAVKELARAQCEAAAQLRHQKLQEQQAQSLAQPPITDQPLTSSTMPRDGCKRMNSKHPHAQCPSRYKQHPYYEQNRHAQMSPPLLALSTSPGVHNHSSIDVHRGPTSLPTTPASDRSPIGPLMKSLNRSQNQLQREASGSISPGLPTATLDLSSAATTNSPHELSTLV